MSTSIWDWEAGSVILETVHEGGLAWLGVPQAESAAEAARYDAMTAQAQASAVALEVAVVEAEADETKTRTLVIGAIGLGVLGLVAAGILAKR